MFLAMHQNLSQHPEHNRGHQPVTPAVIQIKQLDKPTNPGFPTDVFQTLATMVVGTPCHHL